MTDFLAGLDVSIFRALNDFCGWNPTFDRIVVHLEVIRGSLFMGIVGGLWYWADEEMPRRRETLLTMILAVAVALVVNRVISVLLPFRNRPMYSIGANAPSFEWHADLEHWSSFPSDNATYLFAIAASFWLISRWGGAWPSASLPRSRRSGGSISVSTIPATSLSARVDRHRHFACGQP
jgi:undecaprenyl-diphosphatase